MSNRHIISTFFLLLTLTMVACTGDSAQVTAMKNEKSLLEGRWTVAKALRNGQPTESLDGLFFDFGKDAQLTTNMFGTESTDPYTHTLGKVEKQGETPLDLKIASLNEEELVITTALSGFEFHFTMNKSQ